MKKFIVLCSALVFGLCSESYAWEVDLDEIIDQKLETFTPKLSLVAVQERMTKMKSISGDTGLVQREFRRLYNDWLSNNTKWTGQGRNSTIDNIQGYCSPNWLIKYEAEEISDDCFYSVLRKIENKINAATGTSSTEVEEAVNALEIQKATNTETSDLNLEISEQGLKATHDTTKQELTFQKEHNEELRGLEREVAKVEAEESSKSAVQTAELEVDAADALRASTKIQRNALETAVNDMETSLYADPPTIEINYTSFDLESLAKLWGQDDIGVDVDEDFIVSLRRAWSMQALNMSENAIQERVGTEEGENGPTKTYQLVDPNIFSNSDIATFLLDHFARTDTGSNKKIPSSDPADDPAENTVWNLSFEKSTSTQADPQKKTIGELLNENRDIKLTEGEEDTDVSKEIRDSLMRIFGVEEKRLDDDTRYKSLTKLGIEKNGKEFKTFKNMKFHLNLVALMLQEISKEKDETSATDEPKEKDETSATDEPYEVDSIVFHAFRQYMTQAFREAISLIKASEKLELPTEDDEDTKSEASEKIEIEPEPTTDPTPDPELDPTPDPDPEP